MTETPSLTTHPSAMSHLVQTDGTYWFKTPRPGISAPDGLRRDAVMLAAQGVETRFDGKTLLIPHLGAQIEVPTEQQVEQMIEVLRTVPDDPVRDGLFPEDYGYSGFRVDVLRRVAEIPDAQGRAAARSLVPGEIDRHDTSRVAHCDAHLANWIAGDDGQVYLLDWEHARRGAVETDLGWLYVSILASPRPDLAALVRAAGEDEELLLWAARMVAAHFQCIFRRPTHEHYDPVRAERTYRSWSAALL